MSVEGTIRRLSKNPIITQQKILPFLFLSFNIPRVVTQKNKKDPNTFYVDFKVSFILKHNVDKEKCTDPDRAVW